MSRSRSHKLTERKSIFITGAAGGIGLATARRFAQEGWFIGLADINAAKLKSTLETIARQNGATHLLAVRDRAAWDDAQLEFTRTAGGKLDVLLNNAGWLHGWCTANSLAR
jgi:NADP-dependent 3-hydroxy acid dehydrogenase YdfG